MTRDEAAVFAVGEASSAWAAHLASILEPTMLLGTSADLGALAETAAPIDVCLVHASGADPLVTVARIWELAPQVSIVLSGDDVDDDSRRAAYDSGVAFVTGACPTREELRAVIRMAHEQNRSGSPELVRAMCRAMCHVSQLASGATDASFLGAAVEHIAELFQAQRVSVQLVDDNGELQLVAQRGIGSGVATPASRSGISWGVLEARRPRIILRNAWSSEAGDCAPDCTISASMCVPIASPTGGERARGVVNIARTRGRSIFTARDLEVASSIASLLAETLGVIEARTATVETERRLSAAERLTTLGEIAAGIAHEVANPLAVARANISSLVSYLNEALPALTALEETHTELKVMLDDLPAVVCETFEALFRADEVIRQVKLLARADDGTSRDEPVALAEIVLSVVRFLGTRVPRVRTVLDTAVLVRGSTVELSQILVNLLVNAADACEERRANSSDPAYLPVVTVVLAQDADRVVLTIEDNGIGMSEETKKRAFMPLFTTKPGARGTGLGLPLVRRLVDRHAGSIRVTSALGRGTGFSVVLPAAETSRVPAQVELPDAAAAAAFNDPSDSGIETHERSLQ